jgi:hypothetical protein
MAGTPAGCGSGLCAGGLPRAASALDFLFADHVVDLIHELLVFAKRCGLLCLFFTWGRRCSLPHMLIPLCHQTLIVLLRRRRSGHWRRLVLHRCRHLCRATPTVSKSNHTEFPSGWCSHITDTNAFESFLEESRMHRSYQTRPDKLLHFCVDDMCVKRRRQSAVYTTVNLPRRIFLENMERTSEDWRSLPDTRLISMYLMFTTAFRMVRTTNSHCPRSAMTRKLMKRA